MRIRNIGLLSALLLTGLVAWVGCGKQGGDEAATQAVGQDQVEKVKLTAYIQVSSGCQADTVELLERLTGEYSDTVEYELVNFGSPEGEQRWKGDGLECMTIAFDGSPVVRFPNRNGDEQVVAFQMPPGFSWTLEDLEDVFPALKAGKAEMLTEEEAAEIFAPKMVDAKFEAKETEAGAELLMNGEAIITVQVEAGGLPPLERVQAAQEALTRWTAAAVHPTQVMLLAREGTVKLVAGEELLLDVTKADAKAADLEGPKLLGTQWMRGIKKGISDSMLPE